MNKTSIPKPEMQKPEVFITASGVRIPEKYQEDGKRTFYSQNEVRRKLSQKLPTDILKDESPADPSK